MDHHLHNQDHEEPHEKPYKDNHHRSSLSSPSSSSPKKNKKPQRDEWSEGAVTVLLEAYESKWVLRNRAKLKGQDWDDVARLVSSRAGGAKSAKTLAQCKNKIESMKKRYRSESASADDVAARSSNWPLYSRLDGLLRGSTSANFGCDAAVEIAAAPLSPAGLERPVEVNHPGGGDRGNMGKENNAINDDDIPKAANGVEETESINTTPKANKAKKAMALKQRTKRRDDFGEIGESIRWLAEALIRSEQSRMENMKEMEKVRAEAEAKRAEIDLKMTEIIANTQLEIAKIFADVIKGANTSSGDGGRSS